MKKVFIILILLLGMNLHSQAATWGQVDDYVYILMRNVVEVRNCNIF